VRTKVCESVLRLDVVGLDPRVEVHMTYDGLGGLAERPILRDLVEEIQRKGPETYESFLAAIKRHGGAVTISYQDYVSYGIGGGDATAEYPFLRTMVLWHEKARDQVPEHLALRRNPAPVPALELPLVQQQVERLALG
jgi:hypothetical protein